MENLKVIPELARVKVENRTTNREAILVMVMRKSKQLETFQQVSASIFHLLELPVEYSSNFEKSSKKSKKPRIIGLLAVQVKHTQDFVDYLHKKIEGKSDIRGMKTRNGRAGSRNLFTLQEHAQQFVSTTFRKTGAPWIKSNAYETEGIKCDQNIVKNAIEFVTKNPEIGEFFVYLDPQNPNEICGSIYVTYEDESTWWIQSVYVSQNHRRKGVFSALFNGIIERAKNQGVSKVQLCVCKDNEKAKKAYNKVGLAQNGYMFYGIELIFGESDFTTDLESDDVSNYSIVQDQPYIQTQPAGDLVHILGEPTETKNSLTCLLNNEVHGYCEYYEQFCDWRGGTVIIISSLLCKGEQAKKIIESLMKYLYRTRQNVGGIRFMVNSEELNSMKRLTGGMQVFGYDVMEIEI